MTISEEKVLNAHKNSSGDIVLICVLDGGDYHYGWCTYQYDLLNTYWADYGTTEILIDYSTLGGIEITYDALINSGADVLLINNNWIPLQDYGAFTESECQAIKQYINDGAGLFITGGTFNDGEYPELEYQTQYFAPLLGIDATTNYYWNDNEIQPTNIIRPHPIFNEILDPYSVTNINTTVRPEAYNWNSVITTGEILAISDNNQTVIIGKDNRIYHSSIPQVDYDTDDYQFVYNVLTYCGEYSHWLSVNPISGIVPVGSSMDIEVTLDATGLAIDSTYYTNLVIKSNDPDEPEVIVPVDLTVEFFREAEILLNGGWNLVSWNADVEDNSTRIVLEDVIENLIVALGFDGGGLTFDPTLPDYINTLNVMDYMHGFWLKMATPDTLIVIGTSVNPQTPYYLSAGWNLISYLPGGCDSTCHALSSILDNLIVALGFDGGGLTFDPDLPDYINTLNIVRPGFGYWVKLENADTLIYPHTQVAEPMVALAKSGNNTSSTKYHVSLTNEWINIYGMDIKLDKELLHTGTVVRAVDPDSVVCGTYVISEPGRFGLMPIYRDDTTTPDKDEGASPKDKLSLFLDDFEVPFKIGWKQNGDIIDLRALMKSYGIDDFRTLPKTYALNQNYPNPFNPMTTIKYQLPKNSDVRLVIYNIMGQEVRNLVSENQPAGYYQIIWDGKNDYGLNVSSGIYLCHITVGKFIKTRKMLLVK